MLAGVNRRAAASSHPDSAVISPGCLTHSIHRNDESVHTQVHGADAGSLGEVETVPLLVSGIDVAELERPLIEHLKAMKRGEEIDSEALDRSVAEAGRRSVEPLRGALRPSSSIPPQSLVPPPDGFTGS